MVKLTAVLLLTKGSEWGEEKEETAVTMVNTKSAWEFKVFSCVHSCLINVGESRQVAFLDKLYSLQLCLE